jgi:hypothetical protein
MAKWKPTGKNEAKTPRRDPSRHGVWSGVQPQNAL